MLWFFFGGVIDMLDIMLPKSFWDCTGSITATQLIKIILFQTQRHPEWLNESAGLVSIMSLGEAYPRCMAGNAQVSR
jgi:hypothetical protein